MWHLLPQGWKNITTYLPQDGGHAQKEHSLEVIRLYHLHGTIFLMFGLYPTKKLTGISLGLSLFWLRCLREAFLFSWDCKPYNWNIGLCLNPVSVSEAGVALYLSVSEKKTSTSQSYLICKAKQLWTVLYWIVASSRIKMCIASSLKDRLYIHTSCVYTLWNSSGLRGDLKQSIMGRNLMWKNELKTQPLLNFNQDCRAE